MSSSAKTLMPLEQHPYNNKYEIPKDTRLLIVGTAPPPRFSLPRPQSGGLRDLGDADFFYGSDSNYLWTYLMLAANEPELAEPYSKEVEDEDTERLMRQYLVRHRMWMKDVLQVYSRKSGRQNSSSDSDIAINDNRTKFVDFFTAFNDGKKVEKVVFTSVAAADWFFCRALAAHCDVDQAIKYKQLFLDADKARRARGDQVITEKFCSENFSGRVIDFYVASSPSPSAGASKKQRFIDIYRRILFEQE